MVRYQIYYMDNDAQKVIIEKGLSYERAYIEAGKAQKIYGVCVDVEAE